GATPNPGSTLQSIKRGQATEIDYLNGAVVRAAQAIGRTAPVNAELVKLVHEVERTKAFLTPAEVTRRVG
ncbi:MAG: ketopantoate reductase family protein, partial [Actinobacteria bacterium]|nr:ketopantoate reductase family protein [Actinomycetota bacterium]